MFPPAAATTRVTADTMPSRSAPCTLTTYGSPSSDLSNSGATDRTEVTTSPSDESASVASSTEGPVQIRVIVKWPRRRVMVESVRLAPTPASASATSATMPVRSGPMTVMASSCTRHTVGHAMTLADNAIAWYDANARDLPWRAPGTSAWGVLVSEVMLQQTPVVRVEPAWRSWMVRWPTPGMLA